MKRLHVWIQAKDLALDVYKTVLPYLPDEEKWGLSSQLRRSSISISANIAEGYGRFYYQANVQFCYNARGSLQETISLIILATELGFIPQEVSDSFIKKADELVIQLNAYISYLKNSKIKEKENNLHMGIHEETGINHYSELSTSDYEDD